MIDISRMLDCMHKRQLRQEKIVTISNNQRKKEKCKCAKPNILDKNNSHFLFPECSVNKTNNTKLIQGTHGLCELI